VFTPVQETVATWPQQSPAEAGLARFSVTPDNAKRLEYADSSALLSSLRDLKAALNSDESRAGRRTLPPWRDGRRFSPAWRERKPARANRTECSILLQTTHPHLQTSRQAIIVSPQHHSDMKRRFIFVLVAAVLTVNLFIGARIYSNAAQTTQKDSPYTNLKLFSQVLEKVRRDYVDGKSLSYQELVYDALKGMIDKLDPHSEFLDPERYRELQSDTEGHFGGLGIVISMKDNFVTVIAPMEDTPGFRAGILSGDRIVKIEDKSTESMGLQDAVKLLRGDPGTEVNITVLRPSSGLVKDYKLTRAFINVDMVKDINGRKEYPLPENKIGYVRILSFGDKTSEELETALKKLKGQGMQALILDLRWNPGGLLDQAVDVCEKFLPRSQLVVSTEGRNPGQNSVRRAGGHGDELVKRDGSALPMVVLVNPWSASASEIVAGCLQDLHRAVVLGEKTFGKGSVQSIFSLDDGSALRLTTAKYYTPSHKVIHQVGITPDVIVPLTDDEDRDFQLKRTPGGIETLDERNRDRVRDARDPQMERATDLLTGILLFAKRAPDRMIEKNAQMAAMKGSEK
jgi:carboxyl-terminal processing protease